MGNTRGTWLLSNNRLEEVNSALTKCTFSNRLLLSNQDEGCFPSVAQSLGPALHNLFQDLHDAFYLPRKRLLIPIFSPCSAIFK